LLFRSLRARGYQIKAIEQFGHEAQYPVTSNWPHLVQQLADFVVREARGHPGPLYLVGHSLGGYLSLMCAARHPVLDEVAVAGVVLLDSPLLGGWRARAIQAMKGTRLIDKVSPGQVSRKRRQSWPSAEAAWTHYAARRPFSAWNPQVLHDYIEHGTQDVAAGDGVERVLRFSRDIETQIYNTLPHNMDRLLKRHPLHCPLAFLGGTHSTEIRQVGMSMTRKLVGSESSDRLQMLAGSHLFPMEKPLETAAAIDRALRSFTQ